MKTYDFDAALLNILDAANKVDYNNIYYFLNFINGNNETIVKDILELQQLG